MQLPFDFDIKALEYFKDRFLHPDILNPIIFSNLDKHIQVKLLILWLDSDEGYPMSTNFLKKLYYEQLTLNWEDILDEINEIMEDLRGYQLHSLPVQVLFDQCNDEEDIEDILNNVLSQLLIYPYSNYVQNITLRLFRRFAFPDKVMDRKFQEENDIIIKYEYYTFDEEAETDDEYAFETGYFYWDRRNKKRLSIDEYKNKLSSYYSKLVKKQIEERIEKDVLDIDYQPGKLKFTDTY